MKGIKKYTKMILYSVAIFGVLLLSSSLSTLDSPKYDLNVGEFSIFKYSEDISGVTILGLRDGLADDDPRVVDMVIPDEINGKPVVKIDNKAFYRKGIGSLTIGVNLKEIGDEAFTPGILAPLKLTGELNLVNVEKVGKSAFASSHISSLIAPELKHIGPSAFIRTRLTTVDLPNVVNIESQAFSGVTRLTGELNLPEVVNIGWDAFQKTTITNFKAPKVETVEGRAFSEVAALTGELNLPEVINIEFNAFQETSIESLNAPKVETIGGGAFNNVTTLTKVNLKDTVSIRDNAFDDTGEDNSRIVKIVGDNWDGIVAGTGPTVNGYKFPDAWYLEDRSIFTTEEVEGGLSITGLQPWVLLDDPRVVDMVIPDEIDGLPVVDIANNAFYNETTIKTLKIGSNVKAIGDSAFNGVAELTGELNLPEVVNIGMQAFSDTSVTGLNAPKVTTIEGRAFNGVTTLTGELNLPEVTSIGDWAFRGTSVTSLNAPKVETIGGSAFQGVSSLANELNLPEVTSIGGRYAFQSTKITGLNAPKVEIIGGYAFNGVTTLTEVTLKDTVSIGLLAFNDSGDPNSRTVNIVGDNWDGIIAGTGPTVNGYKFSDAWYLEERSIFTTEETTEGLSITGLQEWVKAVPDHPRVVDMVIPDEIDGIPVVSIADNAFKGNQNIKNITIGSNLKVVGDSAFERATGLSGELDLHEVTSVGSYAFMNVPIESLSAPNVEIIGGMAFYTSSLSNITIKDTVIINRDGFYDRGADNSRTVNIVGGNWGGIVAGTGPMVNGYRFARSWHLEDRLMFTISEVEGGLSITGLQPWVLLDDPEVVDMIIPDEIKGKPVVSIADNAFYDEETIKTLKMSDSVKTIGSGAFNGAKNLTGELNLPEVTEIKSHAFANTNVTNLIAPKANTISQYAFDTSSLSNITLSNTVSIESMAFNGDGEIDSKIINIIGENWSGIFGGTGPTVNGYKFSDAWYLEDNPIFETEEVEGGLSIVGLKQWVAEVWPTDPRVADMVIPDEIHGKPVVKIGESAFNQHTGIATLKIGANVNTIEDFAFYWAWNLSGELDLHEVTSVGNSAFTGTSIESLNAPKVKTIGDNAFKNADELTGELYLPEANNIGYRSFYDTSIESINAPKVKIIGERAFESSNNLGGELNLPEVIEIGEWAFIRSSIASLNAPKAEVIKESAFYENNNLDNITLKDTVLIGEEAFNTLATQSRTVNIVGDNWDGIIPGVGPTVNGYKFTDDWYLERPIFTTEEVEGGLSITGLQEWVPLDEYRVENMVIPDKINGMPVVSIKDNAFDIEGVSIRALEIGENLKEIGSGAFKAPQVGTSYSKLSGELNLRNVEKVGDNAFAYTGTLSLNANNLKEIGQAAFFGSKISKVEVRNIEQIGTRAFYNTSNLSEVILGGKVNIGANAFDGSGELNTRVVEVVGDAEVVAGTGPTVNGYRFSDAWYLGSPTVEDVPLPPPFMPASASYSPSRDSFLAIILNSRTFA